MPGDPAAPRKTARGCPLVERGLLQAAPLVLRATRKGHLRAGRTAHAGGSRRPWRGGGSSSPPREGAPRERAALGLREVHRAAPPLLRPAAVVRPGRWEGGAAQVSRGRRAVRVDRGGEPLHRQRRMALRATLRPKRHVESCLPAPDARAPPTAHWASSCGQRVRRLGLLHECRREPASGGGGVARGRRRPSGGAPPRRDHRRGRQGARVRHREDALPRHVPAVPVALGVPQAADRVLDGVVREAQESLPRRDSHHAELRSAGRVAASRRHVRRSNSLACARVDLLLLL
mmetsp:Transcript_19362/g.58250  ORF Transcript_19362/g.58250 Transcript_19362/m.58250 type:complete len:289 (-) Transcript_19362:503-1369(-)